ncbi:MAG: DUF554 domain-containing protein [Methanomicrobia archaeon]|nr:DUF554 domain-containing protein [Methanomicrobia archaeon]
MLGTYVNVVAVIIGSIIGVLLHQRFPENLKKIGFQAIGLCVLFLGISMALKTENFLILILSMLIGALIGEALHLDRHIDRFGAFLKAHIGSTNEQFSEGLVTAFLIYCTGAMTVIGAIEDGLNSDPSILFAKSLMDGCASIALASTFGIGVLFSAIPLFIFQGGITLLAASSKAFFTETLITELSAVGGVILMGLSIQLLDLKEIKVVNLLPALIVVIVLVRLFV